MECHYESNIPNRQEHISCIEYLTLSYHPGYKPDLDSFFLARFLHLWRTLPLVGIYGTLNASDFNRRNSIFARNFFDLVIHGSGSILHHEQEAMNAYHWKFSILCQ
jgi:hypothetical protein